MQDQDLAVAGLLLPLRQKECGEGGGSAFQNPTRGSCRKGPSERSNSLPWRDGQAAETRQEGSQERKHPNFTLHPSVSY